MSSIPETPTKQCATCGETFPATTEFWHRQKRGKYGLKRDCKTCVLAYARVYYQNNSERIKRRVREYKEQTGYDHKRYWSNPDKARARTRAYRESNRDKSNESTRRWRENNPGKVREYRESNREKKRERNRQWALANPDKCRAHFHNRRARKLAAEGSYTAAELREQFKRQKGKCFYCGEKLPKQGWHADHVIPLSKGGANYISNIVCACHVCNESKGAKLPHEWDGTDRLL